MLPVMKDFERERERESCGGEATGWGRFPSCLYSAMSEREGERERDVVAKQVTGWGEFLSCLYSAICKVYDVHHRINVNTCVMNGI